MRVTLRCIYIISIFIGYNNTIYFPNYKTITLFLLKILVVTILIIFDLICCVYALSRTKSF
jgi:hypothetical protein